MRRFVRNRPSERAAQRCVAIHAPNPRPTGASRRTLTLYTSKLYVEPRSPWNVSVNVALVHPPDRGSETPESLHVGQLTRSSWDDETPR